MEPSVLLLLALLVGFVLLLVSAHPKTSGHLPPGPRPLPFLGNLLQMDRGGLLNSFMRVGRLVRKRGDADFCLAVGGAHFLDREHLMSDYTTTEIGTFPQEH